VKQHRLTAKKCGPIVIGVIDGIAACLACCGLPGSKDTLPFGFGSSSPFAQRQHRDYQCHR
jgi:hypothetical protein